MFATSVVGVIAAGCSSGSTSPTDPPGFLLSRVEITMPSIAALTSPILDEFAGGLSLVPDGLAFPGVAWLEITGLVRQRIESVDIELVYVSERAGFPSIPGSSPRH